MIQNEYMDLNDHQRQMGFDTNKLYTMKKNRISNTLRPAKSLSIYSTKNQGVSVRVKMLPQNDSRNNSCFSKQKMLSVSGFEHENSRTKSNGQLSTKKQIKLANALRVVSTFNTLQNQINDKSKTGVFTLAEGNVNQRTIFDVQVKTRFNQNRFASHGLSAGHRQNFSMQEQNENQQMKKIKNILEKHTPRVQEEQLGGDKQTLRLEHQSTITPKNRLKDLYHGFGATIRCTTKVSPTDVSKENISDHTGFSKEFIHFGSNNFDNNKKLVNSNLLSVTGTQQTSKISTKARPSQICSQDNLKINDQNNKIIDQDMSQQENDISSPSIDKISPGFKKQETFDQNTQKVLEEWHKNAEEWTKALEDTTVEIKKDRQENHETYSNILYPRCISKIDYKFDHFGINNRKQSKQGSRKSKTIIQTQRPGTQKVSKRTSVDIQKYQTLPYGGFTNKTLQVSQKIYQDIAENKQEGEKINVSKQGSKIFVINKQIQPGPPDTYRKEYQNIKKLFQRTLDEKKSTATNSKNQMSTLRVGAVKPKQMTKQNSFLKKVQNFQSKTNRSKRRQNKSNMDGSYIQSDDLSNNDLEDISDSKNDLGLLKLKLKKTKNSKSPSQSHSPISNSQVQTIRNTKIVQLQKLRLATSSKLTSNNNANHSELRNWKENQISQIQDNNICNSKFSFNNEIQVLNNAGKKEKIINNSRNENQEEALLNQLTQQRSELEKSTNRKSELINENGQGKTPILVNQKVVKEIQFLNLPNGNNSVEGRQNSAQNSNSKLSSIYKSHYQVQPKSTKNAPVALEETGNEENYTLCKQVIRQNQANRSVGGRSPHDYSRVTQFGNQKDILNITTLGNVMAQAHPKIPHTIHKRSKTPKTNFYQTDDQQQNLFQFVSTFESKKDVYLQKYYESQRKIQLRNKMILQREQAMLVKEQEKCREGYEIAHQAYYEQMENMRHAEQIEKMQNKIKGEAILQKFQSQTTARVNNGRRNISSQLSGQHESVQIANRSSNGIGGARNRACRYLSEIQNNFDKFDQNKLFRDSRHSNSTQGRKEQSIEKWQTVDIDDYNDGPKARSRKEVARQSFGSDNYRGSKNVSIIGLDLGESSNHYESDPSLGRTDQRFTNPENEAKTVETVSNVLTPTTVMKFPDNPFASLESQKIIITTQEDFQRMNFDPEKHTLIMVDENFNVIDQKNRSRRALKANRSSQQRQSWGEVQKSGVTASYDTGEDQHLGIAGAAKGRFQTNTSLDQASHQKVQEQNYDADYDGEDRVEQNVSNAARRSTSGKTRQIKWQKYPKGMVINQMGQNQDLASAYHETELEGFPILESAKLYNQSNIEGAARSHKSSFCAGSKLSIHHRDERQGLLLQSGLIGKQMGTIEEGGAFHKRSKSTKNIFKRVNLGNPQQLQRGMSPHIHKSIKTPQQNQEQIQQQQLQKVLQQLNLPRQSQQSNKVPRGKPTLWRQKQQLIEKLLNDGQLNEETRRQTIQLYQHEMNKNQILPTQNKKNVQQTKPKGQNTIASGNPVVPSHIQNISRVYKLQTLQHKALGDQEHRFQAAQHRAQNIPKKEQDPYIKIQDTDVSKGPRELQLMVQGYSPKNNTSKLFWQKRNSQSLKDPKGKLIVIPALSGESQQQKENAAVDADISIINQDLDLSPVQSPLYPQPPNFHQENLKIFVIQSAAHRTPTNKPFTDRNNTNGDVGCTKRLNSPVNNNVLSDYQKTIEGAHNKDQAELLIQISNTPPVIFIQASTLLNSNIVSNDNITTAALPGGKENEEKVIANRRQIQIMKKPYSPANIQHRIKPKALSKHQGNQQNEHASIMINSIQDKKISFGGINNQKQTTVSQAPGDKAIPIIHNFKLQVNDHEILDEAQTLESQEPFNSQKEFFSSKVKNLKDLDTNDYNHLSQK